MNRWLTFKRKFRKLFKWWVLLIICILIVFRILLPYILLRYVNNSLADMKGYNGHVKDIDVRLIRGAYSIKDINIWETDSETKGKDSLPFFKAAIMDLSLEWKSLFHRRLTGEILMNKPIIIFRNHKSNASTLKGDTAAFHKLIRQLIPLTINTLKFDDGEIHYVDNYSKPKVDIEMNHIKCTATNLTNVLNSDVLLPAKIVGSGNSYGGTFTTTINLDPINKHPTFDLNAELKNLELSRINTFLKAYGNFDVAKGSFNVYAEFAGRDGRFKGYIKPLLKDLDVVQWNKEEGNFFQIVWETIVASLASVLTNQSKEQFATKINMEGDFKNTEVGIWTALKYVIVNAYIEALKPNLDHTISIKNASFKSDKKNFIESIFGKRNKGKKSN
ncbi:MAG: DUF748 domain-containing protein [Saprospiraceae bacterium]|nr:DUF748 domain-containing protein [Saprospiraceae bacterium]